MLGGLSNCLYKYQMSNKRTPSSCAAKASRGKKGLATERGDRLQQEEGVRGTFPSDRGRNKCSHGQQLHEPVCEDIRPIHLKVGTSDYAIHHQIHC